MGISAFYFVSFCAVGLILPYLPPYLRGLGFNGTQVGIAVAVAPALSMIAPPLWGFLADRLRRPARVLRIVSVGATAGFAPLLGVRGFPAVVGALGLYAAFWSAISGLADAVANAEVRRSGGSYARLRIWGSLGFVAASTAFGVHLERGGAVADVLPAALGALGATAVAARLLPDAEGGAAVPTFGDARRLLDDRAFLAFLGAGLLHWAALAPFHLFYALHLEGLGAAPRWVPIGLLLGIAAEVAVFWTFPALARRVRLYPLLAASFAASFLRWLVTATTTSGELAAVMQLFHALSFGLFFVASIAHLERTVPAPLRATGRSLYGAIVFGAGGVLGSTLAGPLWDRGGAPLAFGAAAGLELVAPLVLWLSARLAARRP